MIAIFCLRTKNSCRISKSTTLPQVTSDIITFSRMVRFSCVLPLWKAIELTIMPVLTVLKNIENWPFYSQFSKTRHFLFYTLYILLYMGDKSNNQLSPFAYITVHLNSRWAQCYSPSPIDIKCGKGSLHFSAHQFSSCHYIPISAP